MGIMTKAMDLLRGASPKPAAQPGLQDPRAFYDQLRAGFMGPTLTANEVEGCARLLKACEGMPVSWAAYVLATSFHETAGTLTPIREYGRGRGRPYGAPTKYAGQIAYGRGDVQLTWDHNYERADRELGLRGALLKNFDLALDPEISSRIAAVGMREGWFTGKRLADYLPASGPATRATFIPARRIINALDRAELVADYALAFQAALTLGRWT